MCRGAEIDTALLYENHEDIGKALKSLPRAEAHRKSDSEDLLMPLSGSKVFLTPGLLGDESAPHRDGCGSS